MSLSVTGLLNSQDSLRHCGNLFEDGSNRGWLEVSYDSGSSGEKESSD